MKNINKILFMTAISTMTLSLSKVTLVKANPMDGKEVKMDLMQDIMDCYTEDLNSYEIVHICDFQEENLQGFERLGYIILTRNEKEAVLFRDKALVEKKIIVNPTEEEMKSLIDNGYLIYGRKLDEDGNLVYTSERILKENKEHDENTYEIVHIRDFQEENLQDFERLGYIVLTRNENGAILIRDKALVEKKIVVNPTGEELKNLIQDGFLIYGGKQDKDGNIVHTCEKIKQYKKIAN